MNWFEKDKGFEKADLSSSARSGVPDLASYLLLKSFLTGPHCVEHQI